MTFVEVILGVVSICAFIGLGFYTLVGGFLMLRAAARVVPPIRSRREMVRLIPARIRAVGFASGMLAVACILMQALLGLLSWLWPRSI
jgi:hypothetical protein